METEWIFDAIINYIKSPKWKTPMLSFIEEYCLVFDEEDENKMEYTKIHSEYKNLFESLFGDMIKDLGINEELFVKAIEKAAANPQNERIINQLLSVDDFLEFKKQMLNRNKELNQHAMKMLTTASVRQKSKMPEKDIANLEDKELQDAIKESMMLEERRKVAEEEDKRMLEEVLKRSKTEHDIAERELKKSSTIEPTTKPILQEKPKEETKAPIASPVSNPVPAEISSNKKEQSPPKPEVKSPPKPPEPEKAVEVTAPKPIIPEVKLSSPEVKPSSPEVKPSIPASSPIPQAEASQKEEGKKVAKKSPKKSPEPEVSTPGFGALPSLLPALKPGRIKTSEFHVEELEKQFRNLPQPAHPDSGEASKIMPGFITKEMLREKKRQIVKAEKEALQKDMKEQVMPEVKIVAPPLNNLEQKKKIAEAVKAVIKSTREDQERLESIKHSSDESKLKKKTK